MDEKPVGSRVDTFREQLIYNDDGTVSKRLVRWVKPFRVEKTFAKVIRSGPILESYEYEKPAYLKAKGQPVNNWRNAGRRSLEDGPNDSNHEACRRVSTVRAKNMVRRLALENFTAGASKFITLTFSDNPTAYNSKSHETWSFKHHAEKIKVPIRKKVEVDGEIKIRTSSVEEEFSYRNVEHTNKIFKTFIQRMRYEYGDFKYLAVIEFQDLNGRGAIHYHMMADLPYIKLRQLSEELWGWGFVLITDIKHVDNVGAYISKYMTQDLNDFRLSGKKAYLPSKNLDKPEVLHSYDAYEVLSDIKWSNQQAVYETEYGHEDEFIGRIKYREFNNRIQSGKQLDQRKQRIKDNRKIKSPLTREGK